MALPLAFRERLEQMEQTRNQLLSQLQAEKGLQDQMSQIRSSKLSNIRLLEQRCLKIDCKIVSQHLMFRALRDEVEELKELEEEKECFYAPETREMEGFRAGRESYVVYCYKEVLQLRAQANELE